MAQIKFQFQKGKHAVLVRLFEHRDIREYGDYIFLSPPELFDSIGLDYRKLPSRQVWEENLTKRISEFETSSHPSRIVAAEINGQAIAMVFFDLRHEDQIPRLHFHIFEPDLRRKGLGVPIFLAAVHILSRLNKIERFLVEPKASNLAMNGVARKLGLKHTKDHLMPAGPRTVEMIVSQYELNVSMLPTLDSITESRI